SSSSFDAAPAQTADSHSAIASPEPPNSFGKSFSFGGPFTCPPDLDRQDRQCQYPLASGAPVPRAPGPRLAPPGSSLLVAGTEAMATYPLTDLDDARIIGRQFGVRPTGLAAIAAGSVNSSYRLETARGPSYLVRIYEEATAADAETEARLLQGLAAAGIPTPCPLARLDGRGFTVPLPASLGTLPVALFPLRGAHTFSPPRLPL